ncbi:MAG: hypothetical protein MPK31_01265 [Gammaproteobacteria bacterium]|nr:hypothetical protein [Gammaproteobacteria bacterium]
MISKVKAVLKVATTALLFFAAAPLYADGAPYVPPAQILGFTEANQTPPFITSKDMTRGAASDGSLTFSLDMFFGTDTPVTFGILPLIQYDSAKLDIIEISNVAHAGFFKPEPSRVNDRKFKIADWSRKPAFAGADTEFLLVWMDLNEITAVSGATTENPVRIATIKFQWKAGAVGASQIAIIEGDAGVSDENFRGVSVDIQGVEVAEATAAAVVGAFAPPEPGIWISDETIETAESNDASATATFSVRLTAPPVGGNVVVDIHSLKPTEATVSPVSKVLTFTADNWNEDRPVIVIGKDDNKSDGHQPYTIKLEVNKNKTGATHYHGVTALLSGINKDNETFVSLSASPSCVHGEEQNFTITANLENPVSGRREMKVEITKAEFGAAEHSGATLAEIPLPEGTDSKGETFQINASDYDKTFRIDGIVRARKPGGIGPNPAFRPAEIHVAPVKFTVAKSALNVDSGGGVNARDGIMAMRYLMGVTSGEGLIKGQASADDLRKIKAHLENCSDVLNVDGNDNSDHYDGALIARYLFGLRNEDLFNGLGIPETKKPEVKKNLADLCPGCEE